MKTLSTLFCFLCTTIIFSQSITQGTLSDYDYCKYESISVPFTSTGINTGDFTVNLKLDGVVYQSAFGSSSPIVISLTNEQLPHSTNYTIEVVHGSTNSNPSNPITVRAMTHAIITDGYKIQSSVTRCVASAMTFHALLMNNKDTVQSGLNYIWKKSGVDIAGAVNNTLIIDTSGLYTVQINSGVCNLTSPALNITTTQYSITNSINNPNGENVACMGTTKILSSNYLSNTASYQWYYNSSPMAGKTGDSLHVNETGNYSLSVAESGCDTIFNSTYSINFGTGLKNNLTTSSDGFIGDTSLCGGNTIEIKHSTSKPNNYSYKWFKNGLQIINATNNSVNINEIGSYYAVIKEGNCITKSKDIQIVSAPKLQKPTISIGTNGEGNPYTPICSGSAAFYTNGPASLYGNNVLIDALSPFESPTAGWHKFVRGSGTCLSTSDSINLTFAVASISPTIFAEENKNNICGSNDGVILRFNKSQYSSATPLTFQWRKNGIDTNGEIQQGIFAPTAGTYDVLVSNGTCIGYSNAITITNNNTVSFDISASGGLSCSNDLTRIFSPALPKILPTNYQWKRDGVVIPNEINPFLYTNQSGTYVLSIDNLSGCTATSNSLVVTHPMSAPPPAPIISMSGSLLSGQSIMLNATGCESGTITWYEDLNSGTPIGTGPSYATAPLSVNKTYSASCAVGGCTSLCRDSIFLVMSPVIAVNIPTTKYCSSESIPVSFTANVLPPFAIQILNPSNTILAIQNINTASPTNNYMESIVIPSSLPYGTQYKVKVIAAAIESNVINNITIGNLSSAAIVDENGSGITNNSICPGATKKLYAKAFSNTGTIVTDNVSYQWSANNIPIPGATNIYYEVNTTGNYKVAITKGCTKESFPQNIATSTGISTSFANFGNEVVCSDTTKKLISTYVTNTSTYVWKKDNVVIPDSIGSTLLTSTSGRYSVHITDLTCSANGARQLSFLTGLKPFITYAGGDSTLCTGNVNVFLRNYLAGEYDSLQWYYNGDKIIGAQSFGHFTNLPGKYQLEVKQASCLTKSNTLTVISSSQEQIPFISTYGYSTLCSEAIQSITIAQTPPQYDDDKHFFSLNGSWYKDGILQNTGSFLNITSPGNYVLKYGSGACEVSSNTVTITSSPNIDLGIVLNLNNNNNICGVSDYKNLFLNTTHAVLNTNNYEWYRDGNLIASSNSTDYNTNLPGVYKLKLTSLNANCSGFSNEITLTNSSSNLVLTVNGNEVWCDNRAVRFDIKMPNALELIWYRDNVIIPNEYSRSLYTNLKGKYKAAMTPGTCATSNEIQLNAQLPDALFTLKSGMWTDPKCWICDKVPAPVDNVIIKTGHTLVKE